MKLWALVGLFSIVAVPMAHASETFDECQLDDSRRSASERPAVAPPSQSGSAPQALAMQRETASPTAARAEAARRRDGKRIPDAELIGPRGAL